MGALELMALSLALSVVVSALALFAGAAIERASGDPGLRHRIWGAAMVLSALPPVATAILLLTPAPVREIIAPMTVSMALRDAGAATTTAEAAPIFTITPAQIASLALAVAAGLASLGLIGLAVRSARLARLLRIAIPADDAMESRVRSIARDLNVRPPVTAISATATEALLSGLGRARLILPAALASDPAADAMIAHELAHLKRRDHHTLWLEEALGCVLAFNPLFPVLRARRDAAREEACDAVALKAAGPTARRAYADTLIEALRNRAGSQPPAGALPSLTFTGAGRTTAMRRLQAVMNPPAPAAFRTRLVAAVAGLTLLTAAGGATAALAGQREAETRIVAAPAQSQDNTGRELLNGQPLPVGVPLWALTPERVDIRTSPAGGGETNFILPFTGTTPVSIDGRRMPDGFPIRGINPDAIAEVDMQGDHMMVTLRPQTEVLGDRATPLAIAAAAERRAAVQAEVDAGFQRASAADYQRFCALNDPGADGFCAGVMFSQMEKPGVCAPAEAVGANASGQALSAFVDRGREAVRQLPPRRDESPHEYAERALKQAFPCSARTAATSDVVVAMPVDLAGPGAALAEGERVRVALVDENGGIVAEGSAGRNERVTLPLTRAEYPALGQGNRVYQMVGDIRDRNDVVRRVAQQVTLRLAAGAERSSRDLRTELNFPG